MANIWKLYGLACKTKGFLTGLKGLSQEKLDIFLRQHRCQLQHIDNDNLLIILKRDDMVQAFDVIAHKEYFKDASDALGEVAGLAAVDDFFREALVKRGTAAVAMDECNFQISRAEASILDKALADSAVLEAMNKLGGQSWEPPECESNYFSREHVGEFTPTSGSVREA